MNTNDLPVTQKLAALIEAGRVAHPNVEQCRGALWRNGRACAMGFAALGAGMNPGSAEDITSKLAEILGVSWRDVNDLAFHVVRMNDSDRASIDQIVEALRTNTLPQPPIYAVSDAAVISLSNYIALSATADATSFTVTHYGPSKAATAPAKKVRKSAKSGATWPTPKGCYA